MSQISHKLRAVIDSFSALRDTIRIPGFWHRHALALIELSQALHAAGFEAEPPQPAADAVAVKAALRDVGL